MLHLRGNLLGAAAISAALTAAIPSAIAAEGSESPKLPNIVVLLADDLGHGDLGCYNSSSKVPTPNLDKLARQGIRFTNAYCPDAVCTPSRYALMTGRYAFRARQQAGVLGNWEPPLIEAGRLTLPGLLKKAGYSTGGFGKWHLGATYTTTDGKQPVGYGEFKAENNGENIDLTTGIKDGPASRGFDQWYGFVCASEDLVFEQNRPVARVDVYDAPTAAGTDKLPVIHLADYLTVTTQKTIQFIREQAPSAKSGKPFFAACFAYVPHIPLAVAPEFKGKTTAGDYGDYVHELDDAFGRVLGELDSNGLSEDTVVIFASDNGSQWPETGEGHHPNAPFRGTKWSAYEGGVHTPLIVRWPNHIPAGSSSEQLAALTDVMASVAGITHQQLPQGAAEDSVNLLPAMLDPNYAQPIRDCVVNRSSKGRLAVREGDWKYLSAHRDEKAELYNLKQDIGETTNLLDQQPEVVSRLSARLKAITRKTADGKRASSPASQRTSP